MTKTPIEPKYIRKGDTIRAEYDFTSTYGQSAHEYVAGSNSQGWATDGHHYLLDRPKPPVVLPTEVGHYLANATELVTLHHNGEWMWNGDGSLAIVWSADDMRGLHSLTKLEPVAETARKMRDTIYDQFGCSNLGFYEDVAAVAAEFGVTD